MKLSLNILTIVLINLFFFFKNANSSENWMLNIASSKAKVFYSKNFVKKKNKVIFFDALIEYFKPQKKIYFSTIYKMQVNCKKKETLFFQKTYYKKKIGSDDIINTSKLEKLELLDNKIKNKKYPFEKNTWWTLLSENICDHKINNIEKKKCFLFQKN